MNIGGYISIFIAAVLSACVPILLKIYINNGEKNTGYLYLSIIVSVLVLIFYIGLIKTYGAAIMYTIVKILSILIVVVIGFLFLGEQLTTKQIIGILFAIIALYLLTSH